MQRGELLAGRYELAEKIDEGGMGEVWRARQVALGREVAIKVTHPERTSDMLRVAERFRREAELAARVEHRNVIDIIDFGTSQDGSQFLVMPFLRGESMERRLQREPAPTIEEIIGWTRSVLGGLGAIHDHGIVHRDLKPANVFLAEDSDGVVPKLLDFGISRTDGTDAQGTALTQTGTAMGTPQYMAPEQFESARDVDLRADLYSVGAMLYEALTGRVPFAGDEPFAIYRGILQSEPEPLRALRPDLPPALHDLVHRALAKDVAARFSSAREMRKALDALVVAGTIQGVSPAAIAAGGTPLSGDIGVAPTELAGPRSPATAQPVARTMAMPGAATPSTASHVSAVEPASRRPLVWVASIAAGVAVVAAGLVAVVLVMSTGEPDGAEIGVAGHSENGWTDMEAPAPATKVDPASVAAGPAPTGTPADETGPTGEAANGLRVGGSGILNRVALRWARLPAAERPEARFVRDGDGWSVVVPATTSPELAERLATALGSSPEPVPWNPDVGLRPALLHTTVRLNVHVGPSIESETIRVLPQDTLLVALYGQLEGQPSTAEGEGALTYFVFSFDGAGWARSSFLEPDRGCLPIPAAMVREAGGPSGAAIRRGMVASRTASQWRGEREDVFLLSARDRDAARSFVGVFETRNACDAGESIWFREVGGVIDEYFLTDTARAGGETLVVVSSHPGSSPPSSGRFDWEVFRLGEQRAVWRGRFATAAFLGRARWTVSGSRDRALRNRPDYILRVNQPGHEPTWFRWLDGAVVEAAAP